MRTPEPTRRWRHIVPAAAAVALAAAVAPTSAQTDPPANYDRPESNPLEQITDPVGPWHELFPNFCNGWTCDDWIDNGTNVLDECDYVHFVKNATDEGQWYHVENVTITLTLREKPELVDVFYYDYTGHDIVSTMFNPLSTQWHEVWPTYCNLHNVVGWNDNGDGIMSPCDQVALLDKQTNQVRLYHIEAVSTDIEIVPGTPSNNLDRPGSDPAIPLPDPIGPWHELYPNYCNGWTCDDWVDNGTGVLDVCDYIHLVKDSTGIGRWYHVEDVTITLTLLEKPDLVDLFAYDYTGDAIIPALHDPIKTEWHEVWPTYCNLHNVVGWNDNGDGRLSYCDQIAMEDKQTGDIRIYHIEAVSTDITIVPGNPPPPCPGDCNPNGAVDVGDLLALLAQWGGPGPCDFDGNGIVDVGDLLFLLASWGPC